jgi:Bacteriophage minor capsid protein
MNAPSKDIVSILEAYGDSSGSGLTFGKNLYIGSEPVSPRNCVTIYDTTGEPPYLGLGGEVGYEYPSIQVRVRNEKYLPGWNLLNEIITILHGLHQEVWNGTLYSVISATGGPAPLERDVNGNSILVVNFKIQRRAV